MRQVSLQLSTVNCQLSTINCQFAPPHPSKIKDFCHLLLKEKALAGRRGRRPLRVLTRVQVWRAIRESPLRVLAGGSVQIDNYQLSTINYQLSIINCQFFFFFLLLLAAVAGGEDVDHRHRRHTDDNCSSRQCGIAVTVCRRFSGGFCGGISGGVQADIVVLQHCPQRAHRSFRIVIRRAGGGCAVAAALGISKGNIQKKLLCISGRRRAVPR